MPLHEPIRSLDPVELRIVGALVEKQMTTPDNYPLTLNGVVAACNQSTNRDPVMELDEDEVERALVRLHDLAIATPIRRAGDRSTKYRHKLGERLEIGERAQAVLAVLMLRGPQTPGELRARTERYTSFPAVEDVEEAVDVLEEEGLVERLSRLPGQSQRRVSHLLGDDGPLPETHASDGVEERLSHLEERFEELLRRLGVDDL